MAQNNFILNLIAGLQKAQSKQQIKKDVKSLGDLYVKLIGNLDIFKTRKYIRNQLKELNNMSFIITPKFKEKGVQNEVRQTIDTAQKVANNNKIYYSFDIDKQKFQNQLKNFAIDNSKLFSSKEMTLKYNQLLDLSNVAKSKSELNALRKQLSAFKTELIATNKVGMTWTDKFKASISHFAQYFTGVSFIYALTNQLRNAWGEAKTLDDSLVDLQKVTSEITDRDALYRYFDKTLNKAQELNVKVGSLIDAVTEFKKLGWSLSDAELGGTWATILENVGDVDIDTAIGSIKTSIASFEKIGGYGNDQMDKKLEAYVDLINNMSNKYSIDAEGLAEAIRLSAGTLTEAQTSIEQAAVMFATANKYYNDPNYLGNTVKIGSLRMRASTGDADAVKELQEMGEEVDNLSTATSKLREKLLALTGVDIMEDEHTFKSYYDQLYEISQVIDSLDDTSRANVLEILFGKSRSAGGAALLSGMKESADAYKDAINSAGSATEEYETWMKSADAATQRFSNNLTLTYQKLINGNTVRDIANLGSAVLEFANAWGIVEGSVKGFLALKIGTVLTNGIMAFITATKSVEQYGKALQMANNMPNGNLSQRFNALKSIAQATSSLTTAQLKQVLSSQLLTQQDRLRILQMQGMTKEMALQKLAEMDLTSATNAQTAANAASTTSTFSLKAAMVGLGATMKSVFLSNPVGITLMAISVGVSAATSAISKHNQKMEEMREKAIEAADKADILGDEIAELTNKYISLSEAVKVDVSAKGDLITTQTELLKKLGLEGESVNDLIAKYGSLSNAIRQASIDSLKNSQIDLIVGVDIAREELLDVAKDNFWGSKNIISASGDGAVKAFKELEKAGVVGSGSYGAGGGQLVLIGDDTVDGALENFQRLEKALETLRDSDAFTAEELSDNSLYQVIYGRYSEIKDKVDAYKSSISNLNENLAQQTMLTVLQGNEIPKTEEAFEVFRQELIDTAVASNQFIGNEKEITDVINNYLSTVPEFEGYYSIPLKSELDKVDELLGHNKVLEIPTTQTISDLEDLNKELDNLGNAMANLDAEGNFDLGNLDSIADYFLGLEEVSYDAEAVNNALKSLGDNNATLEEQADAINTLADQYLTTSKILDQLNEDNAELMKFQLQRMGISNADDIVEAALNQTLQSQAETESTLAQYKSVVTGETLTLTNVTAQELKTLIEEKTITEETANQMAALAIKKQLVNGNTLDTSADINNLIELCKMLGSTTTALDLYNRVRKVASIAGLPSDATESLRKQAEQELQNAIKTGEKSINAIYSGIPKAVYNGSSTVADLLKDTGNAAEQAKDTYEELFDFFERRVDVLNNALELLNANLENVVGSDAKNLLIDAEIGINKESVNNYTDALAMYRQKAAEALAEIPEDLQQKIVDGAVSMTDFIGSGSEDVVNAIKDYQNWSDKVSDCQKELAKLKETIRQLELDKFNNIIEDFTNQFDISTNAQDLINKQIDLFEEAGELIGKGFYEGLIKESQGQLNILEQEKQALVNELIAGLDTGLIEAGTDEWLEMVSALNDVDGSILDCKKDIEEFNNSIQKLHWDIIERIQDNFSDLSDEISNLIGLINEVDVSDKEGTWSLEGLAQLGLYAQEYERAVYTAQMYADEIEKLNQSYMDGGYSATEYADKLSELKKAQWNEINASEEAKDAIIDLNKARIDIMVKGIEEEIDAMKELTDAKIKALDAEKDLNDYRNSLTQKNKSITDLERQIAAMQNDTTAASVAKRKKLEEQLSEAKRDLADFEYEHSIEVQKDALNQQYEDFETEKNNEITALQDTLKEQEILIANSFETVKQNADAIGNEISLIASNHGVTISESLTTAWQSGNDAIASYGMTLREEESQFIISLDNMVMSTYSLQEQADMTAISLANMYNTNSFKLQSDLVNSYYRIANVDTATQALQASLVSTLDGGYDVSSLVNQIDSVGNSAANAANKVAELMRIISNANSTPQYTYQPYSYSNLDGGSNPMVMIQDSKGDIVGYDTLNNAKNKGAVSKFAKGGIVTKDDNNPLNNIAKSVGEDTIIAAKDGEGILTPIQTTEFMKLTANMEAFNNLMTRPFSGSVLNNMSAVQKAQPSVQIHYDNLVQVQGDVNNSNIRQMESIVNNAITKQFDQFNSELYKRGVR